MIRKTSWFGVGLFTWALGACGGEPATSSASGAPYYEKTCVQTACDSCRAQTSDLCWECNRLCSGPGAPANCFSQCSSICDDRCPAACSGDACEKWATSVVLPALNSNLYAQCLLYRSECAQGGDAAYRAKYCDLFARTRDEAIGKLMVCWADHGCDSSPDCAGLSKFELGTLGTAVCDRARRCGLTCGDVGDIDLNLTEAELRTVIKDGLSHCIAEESCAEFKQCANAYGNLLAPFWEPIK